VNEEQLTALTLRVQELRSSSPGIQNSHFLMARSVDLAGASNSGEASGEVCLEYVTETRTGFRLEKSRTRYVAFASGSVAKTRAS
jgi:hypothetical protein